MSDNASAAILAVSVGATVAIYFIAAAWRDRGIAKYQARTDTQPGTDRDGSAHAERGERP